MHANRLKFLSWANRFFIVVLLTVLAGCSQSFVYNFLPRLILWEIDDYVTLTGDQSDRLLDALEEALSVHRSEHIPFYIREMNEIEQTIRSDSVSPQTVEEWYGTIASYRREALAWIAPLGVDQIQELSLAQRTELVTNLREQLQDRRDSRAPETEQEKRERWLQARIESTENIVGPLTAEQREILARSVANQLDNGAYWIDYRQRWLSEFDRALQASDWDYAEELMYAPEQLYSEEYATRIEANRQSAYVTISELINSLSAEQRGQLFDQWAQWRSLLEDISASTA